MDMKSYKILLYFAGRLVGPPLLRITSINSIHVDKCRKGVNENEYSFSFIPFLYLYP